MPKNNKHIDIMRINLLTLTLFLLTFPFFIYAQSANHPIGCAPLSVDFTAGTNLSQYYWDFKNGVISKQKDPSTTFTNSGTYNVELKEGENGRSVGHVLITVYPKPIISLTADPTSGCAPLNVSLNSSVIIDSKVKINNYHWTFGDGSARDNGPMTQHLYTKTGKFSPALEIQTNTYNCNLTKILEPPVEVYEAPVAGIKTSPGLPLACEPPLKVTFTNTSTGDGLTYQWDFANGNSSTDKDPGEVVFDKYGVYRVKLKVTNTKGCVDSVIKIITVGKPHIQLSYPDTVCLNMPFFISNRSSIGFYEWDFSPDGMPQSSTKRTPLLLYDTPGWKTFKFKVTSRDRKCSSDSTFRIYVEDPSAEFTTLPLKRCDDSITLFHYPVNKHGAKYTWFHHYDSTFTDQREDTFTYVENPRTRYYTKNGPIYFPTTLVIETNAGCLDTVTIIDSIFILNARFMPDITRGCAPLEVTFSDSSWSDSDIIRWSWDYGDGTKETVSDGAPRKHTFQKPGIYPVTLIVENQMGCIDTSYIVYIEVGEKLDLDFTVDKRSVCKGEEVHFSPTKRYPDLDIDGWHFHTDRGRAHQCPDDPEAYHMFITEPGKMNVTLEVDYHGCYSTITKREWIEVKGPFARIDYLVRCDSPYHVVFNDSSYGTTGQTWYIEDSIIRDKKHFVYKFDSTGDYTVVLKAVNDTTGCPPDYDTVTVYIRDIKAAIHLDRTACVEEEYVLDGMESRDVDNRCHKGYTWLFDKYRPLTTDEAYTDDIGFPDTGLLKIRLEVEDINGCRDTSDYDTLRVFGIRLQIEPLQDRICEGGEMRFKAKAEGDTTLTDFEWSFGDGTKGHGQMVKHTYHSFRDSFLVKVKATDALGCTHKDSVFFYTYTPQTAIFTDPTPSNICVGSSITFDAKDYTAGGSHLTYDWKFSNGYRDTSGHFTLKFDKPGKVNVILKGTEISSGCISGDTATIRVQDYPVADFRSTLDPDTIGCANSIVRFDAVDHPGGTVVFRSWNLGNGIVADRTPFIEQAFKKGTYDIQLVVSTSFGCMDTILKSYSFIGPEGDISAARDTLCPGDVVQLSLKDTSDVDKWTWEVSGNTYKNVNPLSSEIFITDSRDSANVVLRLFKDECESVIVKPIYFFRIFADFDTTPSCLGDHRFINNSKGGELFEWDLGNGQTSNQQHPIATYTEPGTYKVKLVISDSHHGCVDSTEKEIIIFPSPKPSGVDKVACEWDTVQLNIKNRNTKHSYQYTTSSGTNIPEPWVTGPLGGRNKYVFFLEETDENSCIGIDTVTVDIIRQLIINDLDTFVCLGDPIVLPAEDTFGYYQFEWSPLVNDCKDCKSPKLLLEKTDSFTLRYSSPMGCFDSTAHFKIAVISNHPDIPKAFTPNGDNVNDNFKVLVPFPLDASTVKRFEIFNRWGEKVYENTTPTEGWDGMYKNKPAPNGIYLFLLHVSYKGCEFTIKGDVTLIR